MPETKTAAPVRNRAAGTNARKTTATKTAAKPAAAKPAAKPATSATADGEETKTPVFDLVAGPETKNFIKFTPPELGDNGKAAGVGGIYAPPGTVAVRVQYIGAGEALETLVELLK